MQKFVAKHAAATTGTLSCFDRLLFKGHLALGYDKALDRFLRTHGVLMKDFKPFVLKLADRLKAHAHAVAERAGRPWEYLAAPVRKDQRARAVAARDGITAHVPGPQAHRAFHRRDPQRLEAALAPGRASSTG